MKNILKSKTFIGVFLMSYFLFFFLTIYVWEIKSDAFCAGCFEHGFPFTHYFSTCYGGEHRWAGLSGNILFAGILGGAGGVIFASLRHNHAIPFYRKVRSEEFRAKWYLG